MRREGARSGPAASSPAAIDRFIIADLSMPDGSTDELTGLLPHP